MTPAGEFNQVVRFQQRAPNANGKRLGDWEEPGLKARAKVVPRLGTEPVLQARLQGVQPVSVTVRLKAAAGVDNAWRLVWRGVAYNIKTAVPSVDRQDLEILAQADHTDG